MIDQTCLTALGHVDAYLRETCPIVPAPVDSGAIAALTEPGHRYVVAKDGIYLEVEREWLSARFRIGAVASMLEYGAVAPQLQLKCGSVPQRLLDRFLADARAQAPLETAAWFVWNSEAASSEEAWEYWPLKERYAAHDAVSVELPMLTSGRFRVVDIHSHGHWPAGFSSKDDSDDLLTRETKLCIVFGEVNKARPSVAARLCACGQTLPLEGIHVR